MATLCQTCGVGDYSEFFIYCSQCKIVAEHKYCLNKIPESSKEWWYCEQCEQCEQRDPEDSDFLHKRAKNEPLLSDKIGIKKLKRKRCPEISGLLKKEAPATVLLSKKNGKNQNIKKRKLILADEDEIGETVDRSGLGSVSLAIQPSSAVVLLLDAQPLGNTRTTRKTDNELKTSLRPYSKKNNEDANTLLSDCNEYGRTLHLCKLSDVDKKLVHQRRLMLIDEVRVEEEPQLGNTGQAAHNKKILSVNKSMPFSSLPTLLPNPGNADLAANHLENAPTEALGSHTRNLEGTCNSKSKIACHWKPDKEYLHAMPIIGHVWRGCLNIQKVEYGPFRAHLSNKACRKVSDFAELFPQLLCAEKLPRLDAWPKSFRASPPTGVNIGLFFFPDGKRVKSVVDQLLHDFITNDIVLTVTFDDAELLIFTSIILPEGSQRFLGRYYLWGVFRGRDSVLTSPTNSQAMADPISEPRQPEYTERQEDKQDVSLHHGKPLYALKTPLNLETEFTGSLKTTQLKISVIEKERQETSMHNGESSCAPCSARSFLAAAKKLTEPRPLLRNTESIKWKASMCDEQSVCTSLNCTGDTFSHPSVTIAARCSAKHRALAKGKKKTKELEKIEEVEEGEIVDDAEKMQEREICEEETLVHECLDDGAIGQCRELFPLQQESMAITTRARGTNALGLELGFGLPVTVDDDSKCELMLPMRLDLDCDFF